MYRSQEQLTGFMFMCRPQAEINRIPAGKLIKEIISLNENFIKNYDSVNSIYSKGTKLNNSKQFSKDGLGSIKIDKLISSDWTKRIIVKAQTYKSKRNQNEQD